jgi:Asp-tRNA(Asn)/Glu-tRNA(Gln) amidotransferase B subunit
MLEPKTNGKGSYVKKKKIEIEYAISDYQMKELDVKYDLISIIARINQAHAFASSSATWVISELQKRKAQLPPKASQILNLAGLSVQAMLRLLNLKNCVSYLHIRFPLI